MGTLLEISEISQLLSDILLLFRCPVWEFWLKFTVCKGNRCILTDFGFPFRLWLMWFFRGCHLDVGISFGESEDAVRWLSINEASGGEDSVHG